MRTPIRCRVALPVAVGLAVACQPTTGGPAADTAPPVVGDDPDGSDGTGDGSDGTGDDSDGTVEDLPDGAGAVTAYPPGGLFTDAIAVDLRPANGEGTILACVTSPGEVCTPGPADLPVELTGSGVLHAQVDLDGLLGPRMAWSFVEADAELRAFTSNLPVMVAWTDASFNSIVEGNTPIGLSVFERADGRVELDRQPVNSARARMRVRGSSSAGLDKKNFDLELWAPDSEADRDEELLGLPSDADWVLHAPSYFDDALIRNALGYALSNEMGRYAPRTTFFELFVATRGRAATLDDYMGLYVLVEEIERGEDRVDVARLDADDVAEPEVTGGYVFKRDRSGSSAEEIWAGDPGGVFDFRAPIVPVDPEMTDLEDAQRAYLTDTIDALGRALASSDRVDPTTGLAVADLIDEGSFIDHHILNALVKNPDAFRLSGYFHKDREGPIHAGPLWDLDRTAGSIDSRAQDPYYWDATNITTDTTPLFTYGWYAPLFADVGFRARYWARWSELLEGPMAADAVQARIDAMAAELAEAGPRNHARWGAGSFEGEIDALSLWMSRRIDWISSCIETTADPRTCRGG